MGYLRLGERAHAEAQLLERQSRARTGRWAPRRSLFVAAGDERSRSSPGRPRQAQDGFDWLWLLDDGTLPRPDALERMREAESHLSTIERPSILASKVVWTDGSLHPINTPTARPLLTHEIASLHESGVTGGGLVPIRSASFVSIMVHRDAVARHGLPYRQFVIWNDDLEFAGRVLKSETGYLVLESVAEHHTKVAYSVWKTVGPRFYFEVRNKLLVAKSSSFTFGEKVKLLRVLQHDIRWYLRFNSFSRVALKSVLIGAFDGLRTPLQPPDRPR